MQRINSQVQDLRDVFAEQHYVHPGFRGSTSINAVMLVLDDHCADATVAV